MSGGAVGARGSAGVAPLSGTVTFLFTDIEGSTRLRETVPDAMRWALARCDAANGANRRMASDVDAGTTFPVGAAPNPFSLVRL
jgi:class 3 adenylate cyclase